MQVMMLVEGLVRRVEGLSMKIGESDMALAELIHITKDFDETVVRTLTGAVPPQQQQQQRL